MACETPVVCFDATGPADIIEHKVSGYKAEPFCSTDLANGIEWVLSLNDENYYKLSQNSRVRVCNKFDANLIASQYINLYSKIGDIEKYNGTILGVKIGVKKILIFGYFL